MAAQTGTIQYHELMSSFPTSKRSACDRCRRQKSRCTRSDIATACENCLKLGHACTTGFTRPLGKPTHCSVNGSDGSQVRPLRSPSNELTLEAPARFPTTTELEKTTSESNDIYVSDLYEVQLDRLDTDSQSLWLSPETMQALFPDDHLAHARGPLTPCPSTTLPVTSTSTSQFDQSYNDQCLTDTNLSVSGVEQISADSGASLRKHCHLQLSHLHVRLSHQLQNARKEDCDPNGLQDHPTGIDSDPKSFGNVLEMASELSSILQLTAQSDEASDTPEYAAKPAHRSESSGNVTIRVLSFLLTYCQLATIFEHKLQHVINSLQQRKRTDSVHTVEPDCMRREPCLTGFCIDGFEVKQDSLQTKLLLQTIQHHFQTIEKLLGLPVALRVSGCQQSHSVGLLGGTSSSLLLHAMVTDEHACGLGPVTLLRNSITTLKRLIE